MWSGISPACATSECFPSLGNVYPGHSDLPLPERLELAVKEQVLPRLRHDNFFALSPQIRTL